MHQVLIAGVAPSGEVSTHFCIGMIKLHVELARAGSVRAAIDIFDSVNDALAHFATAPEFDSIVVVDGDHCIENAFLLEHHDGVEFAVGVYPTGVDWGRVTDKIATTAEEPHLVGNTYNVDLAAGARVPGGRYITVQRAGLKIFKMTRAAMSAILEKPGVCEKKRFDFWSAGIEHSTADERLCALWGGPIHADIACKTVACVQMPYGPCSVASRLK